MLQFRHECEIEREAITGICDFTNGDLHNNLSI